MSPFHVWRRSDGLVSWTRGAQPPEDFGPFSFTVLLTTHSEDEARQTLARETTEGTET